MIKNFTRFTRINKPNFLKFRRAKVTDSKIEDGADILYWNRLTQRQYNSINNDVFVTDLVSVDEVLRHNKPDDCWIAINGKVFDVTKFLLMHPGGKERILKLAGRDATKDFGQIHSKDILDKMVEFIDLIGTLDGEFEEFDTEEDLIIRENMANKPSINSIFNLSDFEYVAKKVLPSTIYTYFSTGASDEFSMRENHYAYSRVFFRPKILQEIGPPETKTQFFDLDVSIPVYITAFAGARYANPLGERNLQRAAYNANVIQMVPKFLSYTLDEFFREVPKDQRLWYQLQFDTQEELDNCQNTIRKIESYGNVKGLFINVDLADLGNREKDSKKRLEDLDIATELTAFANNGNVNYPKSFSWKNIEQIKKMTDIPIALKGVQRGEDVVIAAQKGLKAVIISNHGGRQLDFSRPPLEVLAEANRMLKERGLQDKIELYVDGGIRRGSDIIKAICLGAKGVGLGRPFLYSMAGYGEEGVAKVFQILETEMKNNMKLLGVDKIEDLNEDLIDSSNLKFRSAVVNNDRLYDGIYESLGPPIFKNSVVGRV
ncbi:hypothetical protein CANTEDRAFT_129077 [Yamadazyma tenuis ATCC 10573]|uniref:Cytochrome b2, mitochondrial n=1 Tax=Candida tenuis (strain ATCC 10573 / BCRC 21748 / CBS 615 / JCM 9827 / NBRC 10315 / NRRL Y-1498 / VKM Y-70) TaxID=590646 RepID=G3AX98_CANTC|nr:uncharacterized protein CANTEDRAFT_129077 [Yamadazyma tenuis ATCC 10573]EGV66726.1 hypothetical protein CANTEDRAFT_129077 [Yamadazyma tenuis ATCC 10573]